jgi:hypothetical protein
LSTIHEVCAQYTRSGLAAPVNDTIRPAVNISGIASFGTSTSSPTERDLALFEAADTITLQRGSPLFKTGADWQFNRVDITFPAALRPNLAFGNINQNNARGDSWFTGLTLAMTTRPAAWGRSRVS